MHGNAWSLFNAGKAGSTTSSRSRCSVCKAPQTALSNSGEITGREVKINHVSLGMNAINFEPADPAKRGIY